jgi:DNA-binding XRE family transcriptional regulator
MTVEDFRKHLSFELRHLRAKHGYSRAVLASIIGIHRNSLANYEAGGTMPIDVLYQICQVFGVGLHEVIERVLTNGDSTVHSRGERRV